MKLANSKMLLQFLGKFLIRSWQALEKQINTSNFLSSWMTINSSKPERPCLLCGVRYSSREYKLNTISTFH
jgi:hypothetical protein